MALIPPDLQSCLLCDDVRQERNGKFILIGLFDAIGASAFPMRHPRLFVVTRWCGGQGDCRQLTRILGPDQSAPVVSGQEISVRLPAPEATATNVELFLNVEFRVPGTHWVEVLLDGDLRLRYPLQVNRVEAPAAPSADGPAA